jgi:hypothetical protein
MYAAGYKGYNLGEHLYSMRDDRNAVARRNWKNRENEIYVHWLAYKRLNLSFFKFVRFVAITIFKAISPRFVYDYFHKRRLNR